MRRSRLRAAHRRRIGTPRGSRALGPFRPAVLVLRWFRERGCVHCLARDAGVSQATAAQGLPTLADKGYIGAGIGILVPVRRPKGRSEQALHPDTHTTNNLIRGIRALGERAAAELKQRWRALQHVTISPPDRRRRPRHPRPQRNLEMITAEKTSLAIDR